MAADAFRHPDYAIITSFPGLADSTGARVLAEIGDDRIRFSEARVLKAYAGSAPVARTSGARSPSPAGRSRTTASPPSAGSGPSSPPPTANPPKPATGNAASPATATPPPCGPWST
ncbi:transposase [Amycolatopsis sp. AA4]|uniref:transposase n=1 Tax=Amycolatopsis sp. AA4 TaxID=1896961 RepID=UPI001F21395E|nr:MULTISPECIES: transposase [Actinomycetes]